MTTNESDQELRIPLRILTEDEMRNGLDLPATRELARQAKDIAHDRFKKVADDVLTTVENDNRRLAARMLAGGRPAYIKVDGVDGIVRQMPDGTRSIVDIVDGVVVVGKRLPPAGAASE